MRGRTAPRAALGALLLLALGAAGWLATRGGPGAAAGGGQGVVVEGRARVGAPAPRVELPGLDGGRVRLADFRGRPLVVNFWASWCGPCVEEMPAFERAHQRLGERVAFLGIAQRDERGAAQALAARTGVTYPLAHDPAGRSFDAFGGLGMPATAFIRPDGTLAAVHTGQLSEERLLERTASLLGARP